MKKVHKLVDSFNYAIDGLVYALRTQRNMRIHFVMALVALILSVIFDISKIELLILLLTISLVIITEIINTAIETVVDLYTREYHPLARIAKNVAAGAVLFAALNAVVVGYIIFLDELNPLTLYLFNRLSSSPIHLTFVSFILTILVVIIVKIWKGAGTPLRGGMPSGHSALAFSVATVIALISNNAMVASLVLLLAFLVAQSRVESKIHSLYEVIVGGLIGILITILVFQLFI